LLVIKRKRKYLRGKKSVILFYPAIIANPTGPAKRSAYLATPNAVSTRVPSHTLNRCPPRYGPHHDCEAASSPNPPPMLHKPQLNTVDPLIDSVVAYAKAIHAPNIAFGCATTVIFFSGFLISLRFSSYFSVFSAAGFGFLPYRRRWAPPAAPRRARRRPHGPQAVSRGARLHLEGPQAGGGAARGPSAEACRPGGGGVEGRPEPPPASSGSGSAARGLVRKGTPRRSRRWSRGLPTALTATAASQASAHAAQTRSHPG